MILERLDKLLALLRNWDPESQNVEFILSLRTYFIRKGSLSEGQEYHLKRLETINNPDAVRAQEIWGQNYGSDHRLQARRMARYYQANPPYFSKLVHIILSDPDGHILTEKQWSKFCNNKYAKKLLVQYKEEPLFTVGQMVQIRKNNRADKVIYNKNFSLIGCQKIANKHAVVLAVNCKPMTRSARGARIYKVLPVGLVSPIFVHESDLKKGKKNEQN